MLRRRIVLNGFVATLRFAGTSLAQYMPQQKYNGPVDASSPPATQMKRCKNLGLFVRKAAIARDQHESEHHFLNRVGKRQLGRGMTALIEKVFNDDRAPEAWQKHMQSECTKKIS